MAEIQHDKTPQVLYGLKCSSEASSGGTTRTARRLGRLLYRLGPCVLARAIEYSGQVRNCVVKSRRRLMSRIRLGRQPELARAARQSPPAWPNANRVEANPPYALL